MPGPGLKKLDLTIFLKFLKSRFCLIRIGNSFYKIHPR